MRDSWIVVVECTTSSSQNSLTGGLSSSSSQNSLPGGEVTGSSQNPIPGGATYCAAVDFPGSDLACGEVAGFSGNISESQERSLAKGMRGGYTCCVPGCYNNNKKDKEVSCHKFPKDKLVREKWINAIKRNDFIPTNHHRVCSNHFMGGGGGERMNLSDIPTIFPLLPQPMIRKEPKLRVHIPPNQWVKKAQSEPPKPLVDDLFEEILALTKTVGTLQDENASL